MSTHFDDELLRPTLGEQDDLAGFDRPWNPWSLVTLTFFFGLLAGGSLLAFNFERLGLKGRLLPMLALVAAGSLAIMGGYEWVIARGIVDPRDQDAQRTARWVARGLFCLIAVGIAQPQRQRYRLFQTSGLPAGSLWRPGVIAIAAAMVLGLFVHLAFRAMFHAMR